MDVAATGVIALILGALLPLLAIGLVVYMAVRLAIRHEHRNHER
jgi:uncharacterized membrane protein YphA (DoxX/SURF4 family)